MMKKAAYAVFLILCMSPFACHRQYSEFEIQSTISLINEIPRPRSLVKELPKEFNKSAWIRRGKNIPNIEECILLIIKENSSKVLDRVNAVISLEYFGSDRSIPLLIASLSDERKAVVASAAQVLGSLKAKVAVPHLAKVALENTDPNCRVAACSALNKIRGELATNTLNQALHDNDPRVVKIVKRMLREGK